MLYDDYWTEGLTAKQQQTIIDYVANGCSIYKGIGGYKDLTYPKHFLKSSKGREALIRYGQFSVDVMRDDVSRKLTNIAYIRATYNPADIIKPDGTLHLPEDAATLNALGELAYCIEGIETAYDKFGRKTVKVRLCKREDSRQVLEKIFDIYTPKTQDEMAGKKPISEMTDKERYDEINELLEKTIVPQRLELPEPEKDDCEVNNENKES